MLKDHGNQISWGQKLFSGTLYNSDRGLRMQGVLRIAQLPDLVYDAGWPVAKVRCLYSMNMTITRRQTRQVEDQLFLLDIAMYFAVSVCWGGRRFSNEEVVQRLLLTPTYSGDNPIVLELDCATHS
jgi:hypothetical protein